jgi:hypothetical protein
LVASGSATISLIDLFGFLFEFGQGEHSWWDCHWQFVIFSMERHFVHNRDSGNTSNQSIHVPHYDY